MHYKRDYFPSSFIAIYLAIYFFKLSSHLVRHNCNFFFICSSSPKLFIKDGKVKFHPKSVNSNETEFDSKYMIYHVKMKSTAVFIHDASLITPFPLLFFGGNISVQRDQDQETIAVDDWIIFQAAQHTAKLVQVSSHLTNQILLVVCVSRAVR